MSLPAVILCDPDSAFLRVAGLTLLDRLVVAAHRAGAETITVVSEKLLPQLDRSSALGISVRSVMNRPELTGPTLVLSTRLLVQPADLKRLIERSGRLVKLDGTPLPAGVLNTLSPDALEDQLAMLPIAAAAGVAEPVCDAATAERAARALWKSLASSADGLVDKYFNRPAGRALSKSLVNTSVSPNQVSVAATVLGLVSAGLFAMGGPQAALCGALLLQVSAIVDCVDGELARVMFKESPLGKWLDIVGDQIVHIGVFVCIGVGLYRSGSPSPVLPLAVSAAIGVVISFAIVMRGLMKPETQQNSRLQKLIDATTNRDFSVLLILLALVGKLSWFLWLAAIGVHVFWMLALALQLTGQPAAATTNPFSEKRS